MYESEKEKLAGILRYGQCGRCSNIAEPDHGCPYAEDINGNYDFKCNCCRDCIQECCDDI
jgi:hypothetical protein